MGSSVSECERWRARAGYPSSHAFFDAAPDAATDAATDAAQDAIQRAFGNRV